jgi:cytochrome c peroxidase
MKAHSAVLLMVLGVFTLSSCKKEREITEATPATDYDKILLETLYAASDGQGESFFRLPDEGQYNMIPQDPLNPINHIKVQLGELLYHETGIGINPRMTEGMNTMSCASCHHAQAGFQANMRQGVGEGGLGFGMAGEARKANPNYPIDSLDVQPIRTPTVLNSAYQKVMLWNGQFGATGPNQGTEDLWPMGTPIFNNHFGHEGVETQAIAGLGVHRLNVNEEICQTLNEYEQLLDLAFPEFPESTRYTKRTAGLAIAAYERTVLANQSPWQDWLRGERNAISESEKRGAILFFGKAQCDNCHTGPALNSMSFHALGMDDLYGDGVLRETPNANENKGRGGFTQNPEDNFKFKTPQLYNLKDSPFYGHGGNFNSIREVIEYKNEAVPENPNVPISQLADDFVPLHLTEDEITDLTNFIEYSLYDPNLMRYVPEALPSGNCFPNNDIMSQIDQGCIQ